MLKRNEVRNLLIFVLLVNVSIVFLVSGINFFYSSSIAFVVHPAFFILTFTIAGFFISLLVLVIFRLLKKAFGCLMKKAFKNGQESGQPSL